MSRTYLIRGLYNIPKFLKESVVTIGNFDGVHLGHQELLNKLKSVAAKLSLPSVVVIFEPQPMEYFNQNNPVARLTRLREKFYFLKKIGVDYVLVLRFNQSLARLSASDFIQKILINGLNTKYILIGDDFKFGYNRQGDFIFLKKIGEASNFQVESMPTFMLQGTRVSSTLVRKALAEENHALVGRLLGHPYIMMGRIVHGDKRGRLLGFPTANIYLHRAATAIHGVYIVRLHTIEKFKNNREEKKFFYNGVANVGTRPTFNGTRGLLEVHLFDFNESIYGKQVMVEFYQKLRDEVKFSNVELLVEQMQEDAKAGRAYFQDHEELKND